MYKKPMLIISFILLFLLLGLYNCPTPRKDFFKLYPYDDAFSQSLKEFQSRKISKLIIDKVTWTYYSGGQGEKTILFLHGMGGSYDLWWQQIQKFEKDVTIHPEI